MKRKQSAAICLFSIKIRLNLLNNGMKIINMQNGENKHDTFSFYGQCNFRPWVGYTLHH